MSIDNLKDMLDRRGDTWTDDELRGFTVSAYESRRQWSRSGLHNVNRVIVLDGVPQWRLGERHEDDASWLDPHAPLFLICADAGGSYEEWCCYDEDHAYEYILTELGLYEPDYLEASK